jgi:hypothetical protein
MIAGHDDFPNPFRRQVQGIELGYDHGKFKLLRIWNGDETDNGGPKFGKNPVALHLTLYMRQAVSRGKSSRLRLEKAFWIACEFPKP